MRLRVRSLFTLALIAVFALAVAMVWDMPIQAQIFPFTVCAIALPLLVWQLVVELVPSLSAADASDSGVDFAAGDEERTAAAQVRALEFFVWLFAFAIALWGLGFRVAIPVFLLLFMLRHGERLLLAAAFAFGGWAATTFVFGKALMLPLPTGTLWRALGIT